MNNTIPRPAGILPRARAERALEHREGRERRRRQGRGAGWEPETHDPPGVPPSPLGDAESRQLGADVLPGSGPLLARAGPVLVQEDLERLRRRQGRVMDACVVPFVLVVMPN